MRDIVYRLGLEDETWLYAVTGPHGATWHVRRVVEPSNDSAGYPETRCLMFLVIARQGTHRWVSGLFRERRDATSYLDEVPSEGRSLQSIEEAPCPAYPVYLTEDLSGFTAHTRDSIVEVLNRIARVPDDEWHYFNVYRFTEDWRPPEAGTDYMGIVAHVHIHNRHLDLVRTDGIEALW